MTDRATGQVNASAADYYEQHFVPALFKHRTASLLDVAGVSPGDRVLDVGCGTGVLARDTWQHMNRSGSVVGVDLNDGMIETAGRAEPDIEWCVAPAESLPFETAHFDRVISQFALMFFSDREKALEEMWRVTKPGGRLTVAVWDTLENTPGYAAMTALDASLFGQEVADELVAPYSLGDKDELRALFAGAGIPGVSITTHSGMAVFPSIKAWVALDVEGWTLGEIIGPQGHQRLLAAAEEELQEFVRDDGSVAFLSPSHIISADKP